MSASWTRRVVAFVALAGPLAVVAAQAHETKERVAIDWKRDPKVALRRGEAPAPAPPDLPPDLAVAPAPAQAGPPEPPRVEPSRIGRPPGGGTDLEALATRAGEEAARDAVRISGWREHWRAGFARGIQAALDDPRLGRWDHEEGLRFGRSDPRARALGDHLANEAAPRGADNDAEARVRERFMDLSSEPRRDRADARRRPSRGESPRFDGPFALEPVLDDVFVGYPLLRTPGLSREGRRAIEEWRVEPAFFAREDRRTRAHDGRWKDPAIAFSQWRDRQGRGSTWWRLSPVERERFRAVFCDRFESTLRSADLRHAQAAWRIGFDDGWRYGAAIQAEWAYRRGYAAGFDLGVQETAAIAFPYAYDRAYGEAYDRWFDEWSRNPHPGLGDVRLADETGDDVFEPGEPLRVDVEVLNYGGGPGRFDLIASGRDVGQPAVSSVRLGGRGRMPGTETLSLRVGDRVAPRTRSAVTVSIADARVDAPLYISRPFELDGAPTIEADRLQGRVTVTLLVSNTSRRDARGVVHVDPLTGPLEPHADDLGLVPAGGARRATVTFTGIHPLDLIGGESRWRTSVVRGNTIDDAREIRLAPVATDLSNPDLLDFMIALAETSPVSRNDVMEARALLLERLRADWERAAEASGNPYKRDFDAGGAETVLGQLVQVTRGGRRSFASPRVFDGLNDDIALLSEELPGAHPLLRKWMKKLAQRVG